VEHHERQPEDDVKRYLPAARPWFGPALLLTIVSLSALSPSNAQTSVRFAVISEYGSNSSNEQAVANLAKNWTPDFTVTTGGNSCGSTNFDVNIK
jgi:hypothetical protein